MSKIILDSGVWLEEHGDYLYRFALMKLKNSSLAEDMVQETLVSAIAARERYQATASVRTWLTTILRNKIVDHWRIQGRETIATDLMIGMDEDASVDDFFDRAGRWTEMPNLYPDPDMALESKQFWQIFEHCLSGLKPQQAEVFIAREVHGMANDEISKSYSISLSNVFVLMHRARLSLGKCLEIHWTK
jgi:RNA polymerase sigma-70 factor (ECF subfamily)